MQRNSPVSSDDDQGYSEQTTNQEKLSQPERMTGNNPEGLHPDTPQIGNTPDEGAPNAPHPLEKYSDDTRQEREKEIPDHTQATRERKEGYAEEPDTEYIPEINGAEKYQQNYQDNEAPPVTE